LAKKVAKLHSTKFGLAVGILAAMSMVVFSLWVMYVGTGRELVALLSQFYFGYSDTLLGMLVGVLYGFIDGFIGGFLLATIYNKLL
jgi:hypothetical protein